MKWPSLNNENELTWKCKLFGCRDELLPASYYEEKEQHGIKGFERLNLTVATTITEITFSGCIWCRNYRRIYGETKETWPMSECGLEACELCNPNNTEEVK